MSRPHLRTRSTSMWTLAYFPGNVFSWGWRDVFDFFAIARAPASRGAAQARFALNYLAEKTFPAGATE